MTRKIVGKFNKELDKIEFYEITENYKHYTVIRRQGTNKYFIWDNKNSLLSGNLHISATPVNKKDYAYIIEDIKKWYTAVVFFWADSDFVTKYGLPEYENLIDIYKRLINIKLNELEIKETLLEIRYEHGFFNYLKCRIMANKYIRSQRKLVKDLEKEFKLIW